MDKKQNKDKKETLFFRIFNRVLKLSYLKMFEFSLGFVKGFSIKIEFFQVRDDK